MTPETNIEIEILQDQVNDLRNDLAKVAIMLSVLAHAMGDTAYLQVIAEVKVSAHALGEKR